MNEKSLMDELMDEIDELEMPSEQQGLDLNEFENEKDFVSDNFENTAKLGEVKSDNFEMTSEFNLELHKVEIAQQRLGEEIAFLRNGNPSPEINNKIQACETKVIELEEIKNIMIELGPTATINEAINVRRERENEKEMSFSENEKNSKSLVLTNPNVPKELIPEIPKSDEHYDTSFFKTFIYTALVCGALMGTYITMLF